MQPRAPLEHARGDHLHERLERGLHRVADVIDDRAAVAADRARIAARGNVEGDDEAGFFEQRPHRFEARIVVLELAELFGAVDHVVAERDRAKAVLRGPADLAQRAGLIARGDRRGGQDARRVALHVLAAELVRPAVPLAAHRHREHRVGRGPAQEALVREHQLDVDAVGVMRGEPFGHGAARRVAQHVLVVHARARDRGGQALARVSARVGGGVHPGGLHALRAVALGDQPLRAVFAQLEVRNPRAVLGLDALEVLARLDRVTVGGEHEVLIRVAGARRAGPARGARRLAPPEVVGCARRVAPHFVESRCHRLVPPQARVARDGSPAREASPAAV